MITAHQSTPQGHILILGGTAEARKLATLIADWFGPSIRLTTSRAGRTKQPADLAGNVRTGGFGGVQGLADYLETESVSCLIDATHPFASVISAHAVSAAKQASVPLLMLVRPRWRLPDGLNVIRVSNMAEAAASLSALAARRVLLTTGIQDLNVFLPLPDTFFLVRLIDSHEKPLALEHADVVIQKPPFSLEADRSLMEENRIDTLVSKESGGSATEAKLLAAAALGIRVVLIERPPASDGESVPSPEEALAWIQARLGRST